jgi:hypothetical protein
MLVIIAVVVGAVLVGLVGYSATRLNTFWVARTLPIQASPGRIFGLIEDYRQWAAWSPYEKLDPTMQKTFSGSEKGKGAVYSWAGNNKTGEGRMEISTRSRHPWSASSWISASRSRATTQPSSRSKAKAAPPM